VRYILRLGVGMLMLGIDELVIMNMELIT